MDIREKIYMEHEEFIKEGPINIVAFGDSVTHGCLLFDVNQETVYWNLLKKKMNALRDYVPVNMINAGIGGITAKESLFRMERDVLCHHPDLVIVCFGLNDVNYPLEEYIDSLREIFNILKEREIETIFLTPNMMNTYVAEGTPEIYLEYAHKTADMQNSGRMDLFIKTAIKLANEMDVAVCDCYSEWKKLSETEDTTMMLINRINHPTPEMHKLFAEKLFDMIFGEVKNRDLKKDGGMFKEKAE